MRRTIVLTGLLAAFGCGGTSMMTLSDKVFDLVPKEDMAALEGTRAQVDQAKEGEEQAKEAVKKLKDEREHATEDRELADLAAETAAAKVAWLDAKQDWLKKAADTAGKEVGASQAKYQLERARLAETKGLKPYEGFSATKFESQQLDYQKAFVNAQLESDKAKAKAEDAEKKYKKLQDKLDRARKK